MRKAALAIAITLLLSLSAGPALLDNNTPGSSPQDAYPAYAPQATDFVYPVGAPRAAPTFDKGNANGFYISQMFNNSCDPALGQGFYLQGEYFCGHTGVDLADMQEGDPVVAVANGLVVFAGYNSTYGEMVRIQHLLPDGTYIYSQYEHMEYGSLLVGPNQVVSIGQSIGRVGSTGFVTGAHLHFEIKSVNENGVGYTFGNPALILGYYEPIQYIAAHTQTLPPTATATVIATTAAQATAQPTQNPPSDASTPDVSSGGITTSTAPFGDASPMSGTITVSTTAPVSETSVVSATAPVSGTAPTSGSGEAQGVLVDFTRSYTESVTVTADQVNVRAGSGYRFAPLNLVTKGARLGYLGVTGDGWVHVSLPGNITGYIARQLVAGPQLPQLPPTVMDPTLPTLRVGPSVTVGDARYPARNGPLMRDMAVEPLWVGETLPYLGAASGSPSWDKVVLPSGRLGYILNWYLKGPSAGQDSGGRSSASRIKPHVASSAFRAPAQETRITRSRFTLTGPFVVTTVDDLNLRVGPRLGAARIEMMSRGTVLHLRGYHVSWAAVTAADGANGYVLASFISPADSVRVRGAVSPTRMAARRSARSSRSHTPIRLSKPVTAKRLSDPARYVVVAVPAANVRTAPSREAQVVLSAPQGARLAVQGKSGDWIKVEARKGLTGWVMRDLTHK